MLPFSTGVDLMLSQVPNITRIQSDADVQHYAKRLIDWYGERSSLIARISADGFGGKSDLAERRTWQRIHQAVTRMQRSER